MSFAFDIETIPFSGAVILSRSKPYQRQPFVDSEYTWRSDYKQETNEKRKAEWESTVEIRQQMHDGGEMAKEAAHNVKLFEGAALRPQHSRILCISYAHDLNSWVDWADSEAGEVDVLDEFWRSADHVRKKGYACGWNIEGFDLPFIVARSLALRIDLPFQPFHRKKFPDDVFRDLKQELKGSGTKAMELNEAAAMLGLDGKTDEGVDGSNFWRVALEDKPRAERYAKRDAEVVWQILSVMRNCGLRQARRELKNA